MLPSVAPFPTVIPNSAEVSAFGTPAARAVAVRSASVVFRGDNLFVSPYAQLGGRARFCFRLRCSSTELLPVIGVSLKAKIMSPAFTPAFSAGLPGYYLRHECPIGVGGLERFGQRLGDILDVYSRESALQLPVFERG